MVSHLQADRTTIVVAHRLSTITGADDIAVVCGGKVVEHGTHSELLQIQGMQTTNRSLFPVYFQRASMFKQPVQADDMLE